jgi:hypothetical protein
MLNDWQKGPPRASRWKHGLPLPCHRTLAEVMADQRKPGKVVSLQRARKREEDNGPRPPKL